MANTAKKLYLHYAAQCSRRKIGKQTYSIHRRVELFTKRQPIISLGCWHARRCHYYAGAASLIDLIASPSASRGRLTWLEMMLRAGYFIMTPTSHHQFIYYTYATCYWFDIMRLWRLPPAYRCRRRRARLRYMPTTLAKIFWDWMPSGLCLSVATILPQDFASMILLAQALLSLFSIERLRRASPLGISFPYIRYREGWFSFRRAVSPSPWFSTSMHTAMLIDVFLWW